MAQSSGGGIIKWGLIALAGWWVYENYFATPATASPATPATPAKTTDTTPSPVVPSVLDGIVARITAKAGSGAKLDADNWGWYLNNELSALGKGAAPDPVPIFNLDRSQTLPQMTIAEWWGPMSAALKSQMGLSGLGHFGALAALYGRRA
jgi:hypothetical protein